jgi:hypothetical protein
MKTYFNKSFLLIFLSLALVFSFATVPLNAQSNVEVVQLNDNTVANSSSTIGYIKDLLGNDNELRTDSVAFKFIAKGEIDLDTVVIQKGVWYNSTFYGTSTADTTVLTIDNAAAVTTVVIVGAYTAGTNILDGTDCVKVLVRSAASGNDATDPNKLIVQAVKYQNFIPTKLKK